MHKIQARNMLLNVVKHFSSNPLELRSITTPNVCLYNPPKNKPQSIGCAIGMYLPTNIAKYLDNCGYTTISSVFEKYYSYLPDWMQNMDVDFLTDVQDLHDSSLNWKKESISENGKHKVNKIIRDFKLGKPHFKL